MADKEEKIIEGEFIETENEEVKKEGKVKGFFKKSGKVVAGVGIGIVAVIGVVIVILANMDTGKNKRNEEDEDDDISFDGEFKEDTGENPYIVED